MLLCPTFYVSSTQVDVTEGEVTTPEGSAPDVEATTTDQMVSE